MAQDTERGDIELVIGYVRCSTEEQNEERQLQMMQEHHAEKIFMDKRSGKNTDREKYKEMMSFVREGDTVITESISRIARNTKDLLITVEQLEAKGVVFVSLKENIDTDTPQGRFLLTVFGAVAQLERESMLERQREGIEIAKKAGKYRGRKPIQVDEKEFGRVYARWKNGEIKGVDAQRILGLKPSTFYRRVREQDAERV